MESLFDLGPGAPERADISLCIFPHLKEFLAIDLRHGEPRVLVIGTEEVFGEAFRRGMEEAFGRILREPTDHPFSHLMDLPLRVEEVVRETGMMHILDALGGAEGQEEFPTVAVFIIGEAALAQGAEQIGPALRSLLGAGADSSILERCSTLMERLLSEEQATVRRIDRQELRDALEDQSPNFFTLWERRN